MIAKILAGIALALGIAAGVLGWQLRDSLKREGAYEIALKTEKDANDNLVKERDRFKADVARVQAQANKLTLDLRALSAAAATFQENLSDAAKNCPLLDSDRRAVQCLLYPGTAGCGADGARPPG